MHTELIHTVSPAIALLQRFEDLLRDPVLGPPIALQVAAAIDDVERHHRQASPFPLDKTAYAQLWNASDSDSAGRKELQALISLASI